MSILKKCIGLLLFLIFTAGTAESQIIPIKSLPLAGGDQFAYLPAENGGLAGLSMAVADGYLDPFLNPAKGAKVAASWVYTAPAFYRIQNNLGRARTLPMGLYFAGTPLFGGFAVSMQNFDPQSSPAAGNRLSDRSANNLMATGALGFKVNDRLSLGVGASYADLQALDGVQMLYAWNDRVEQEGSIKSGRLSALYQMDGKRELEATLVHQRTDMTHRITPLWGWAWMNTLPGDDERPPTRTELDRHRLWGGHLGFRTPMGTRGWTLALATTYNRKTHPKIPNYDIMRIPRDPGYSDAFRLGLGLSKTRGPVTFGVEMISEPITSKTWAEAAGDTNTVSGNPILTGGRTIENRFKFKNFWYRMGLKRDNEKWGFQLGMQWRNISYRLHQLDYLAENDRRQKENWLEWTFTWGLTLRFPEFNLLYHGKLLTGGGLPGVGGDWMFFAETDAAMNADFIVAPAGALSLQDANVITHRITCVIPL